ncbi:uncharacterized protein HMPREF1541_06262 [Cyphellophora europaea CBS 101466]|uniref:Xylanolytic transcriptional activator regulatory domain-containing protein n=1 Tax=Cyphellophora europaea (strain CBS 101466) TaxID=1220924 RepID=W2RNW8_CYPE1|nr:uncharacterized protein HMPREF1541_06262 [Cyphellophora europaea CBS 101466]ETN38231.1 hypothetical protein HMPREF1541_06262 [Cyphellophora europaea CBS 101466]
MPIYPKPGQAKIYIEALEERVAELEGLLAKEGHNFASRDHWADGDDPDESDKDDPADMQPLLNAVRDLSLDATGSYVGGASSITLGRALAAALAGKTQLLGSPTTVTWEKTQPSISFASRSSSLAGDSALRLNYVNNETANMMVYGYLKHLQTNFPILCSTDILDLHNRRHMLKDVYEFSILNLIYGLGGHFLNKTGESTVSPNAETHYNIAWENREAILGMKGTQALIYLMLLGQHCYRMPKDHGAWTFFGLAMKTCVELGLHRRQKRSRLSLRSEHNKRLFWCCYWHDREVAIAMGRPPSISDHDIDAELPLDVDEATQDIEDLRRAAEQDPSKPVSPQTTMTTFIHLVRLKIIESEIQHKIYRVDRLKSSASTCRTTDGFLERLYAWRDAIPPESSKSSPLDSAPADDGDVYRGYDSYMASYYKTMRLLLQPRLYDKPISPRYLGLCAEACRGLCETYKRLHSKVPISFSSFSLQSVFLAGLTLIYCMWYDTSTSSSFKNFSALSDCSVMLYVMAERWSVGKKYRDLFEDVKKGVLEGIEEGRRLSSLGNLPMDATMNNVSNDLEQMISDMAGQPISLWQDVEDDAMFSGVNEAATKLFGQATTWDAVNDLAWYNGEYSAG